MTPRTKRLLFAAAAALAIYAVMDMAIRDTSPWNRAGAGLGESGPQLDATVDLLFGDHVLAFEVLGILLTAAMIGALVIARPLGARHDADNYSHPTREQLAESRHQSDVRTHFPEEKA